MVFDGWETKAQGKVPKVTMALLMCKLSLNLASSLYVSVHTLRNPWCHSGGMRTQPPRQGCSGNIEVAGLWEGEAESTNAPVPNTDMHTGTHIHMHMYTPVHSHVHTRTPTRWDFSLLESLHQQVSL